jgi:broad specificity phosphatase PhoE
MNEVLPVVYLARHGETAWSNIWNVEPCLVSWRSRISDATEHKEGKKA